ncbi:thiamine phosphate synthase [Anaplasma marginale]|uniref:thiamine phosphate synthase n=2 Tax=Anaplasma marginale TaxID=770 RepID=UPI0009B5CDDC|nr:thiamine phosphate synthase [Anaplasma marginale]
MGQEDVQTADLESILKSKMKLGLSTHCYHELARACFIRPSYVALGPVFHTTSKDMRFKPQGLQLLKQWVQCAKLKSPPNHSTVCLCQLVILYSRFSSKF